MVQILCKGSDDSNQKRMKYSDGLSGKAKDDGINRCLLIGVTPGNEESQDLLNAYVGDYEFEENDFWVGDFKVDNEAAGLQNHSARHPCHSCHWINGSPIDDCVPRTFENIRQNHEAWKGAGSKPDELKDHFNCKSVPINAFPKEGKVSKKMAPQKVHMRIGLVNKLFMSLVGVFPGAVEWPKRLHITKAAYFGGHFEGRQSLKLLENINVLREVIREDDFHPPRTTRSSRLNIPTEHPAVAFADAFQDLAKVERACFGTELLEGWEDDIKSFNKSYARTGDKYLSLSASQFDCLSIHVTFGC